ncbi:MAG: family 16 glycosylhydrolase, partial [Micromonosporaceae bacterium]|nr:family 16 glycosylhydrolase [Micromonosporaceae bacterium]
GLFPYKGTEEDGYLTLARVDQGNRTSMYPELRGIGGKVITGAAVAGDFTAWATYSIEWRADFVVVSLNGAPIIDTRELADAVNIPTVPMYLYIQVVPGPDGPVPSVTPETPEEVVTHVDWVRYSA